MKFNIIYHLKVMIFVSGEPANTLFKHGKAELLASPNRAFFHFSTF